MGTIKKILSFLGIVFDIRDTATFIRRICSVGGAATMITAIINWISENIPTLSLFLFGIGAFLLLMALSPNIIRLFHRQRGITQPKQLACRDIGWWTTLADGDRKDIKHRIPLVDVYAGIESVKKTGYCCIHFKFVFINATVYKVNVGQVDGDIYADGMKLPNKLTIDMKEEELVFYHGVGFGLRCSLLINEPYLQELIKLSGKTVRLGLERINIMADLIDPADQKASEFRLEIPHRVPLEVPDLTTDHQPELRRVDLSKGLV